MQNNTGIEPTGKHLLLDVTPKEQKTAAGIVLPTAVQGASTRMEALVVSKGEDCSLAYNPGQKVLMSKYQGGEIVRNGISYKIGLETDVIAVLDDVSASMPDAVPTRPPIDPGM